MIFRLETSKDKKTIETATAQVINDVAKDELDTAGIAINLNAKDVMIKTQLNTELLNKYDGQYIRIEHYTVKELNYKENNATLNMYIYRNKDLHQIFMEENGYAYLYDEPEFCIYIDIQDKNKTLKSQLKKGDEISIDGKLINYKKIENIDHIGGWGRKICITFR